MYFRNQQVDQGDHLPAEKMRSPLKGISLDFLYET